LRLCLRLRLCGRRSLMSLTQWWAEATGRGLPQGVWKYDGRGELAHHRFHLRVDPHHKGVLIIDAARLVELNGTAVDYVRCILEGRSEDAMYKYMKRRYKNLDQATVVEDYASTAGQLERFIHGDQEVVEIIGTEVPTKGADDFPAPYRMDLILSYKCQNNCTHCYNEDRQLTELSAEEWKKVIARTWQLGIPHVVFTGGEPTLLPFLGDLVEASESWGQVTGLVTNGRMLRTPGYLKGLVNRGLDHVQITILSHREEVHDRLAGSEGAWKETIEGLKVALEEDLYVSTNTTILRSNLEDMEGTLDFLISLGVKNVAFNSIIRSGKGIGSEGATCVELEEVLVRMRDRASQAGAKLIWYTPTPYCELNPINLGLGIKQCTACSLNMAVEPDGQVLPCQSYYRPLGHILKEPWEYIWNNELCRNIRSRAYLDQGCSDCALVDTCGGGCPLARENGDYLCLKDR
jgi:radical SAM protein with 4Fe4S-binding SPASM domain